MLPAPDSLLDLEGLDLLVFLVAYQSKSRFSLEKEHYPRRQIVPTVFHKQCLVFSQYYLVILGDKAII